MARLSIRAARGRPIARDAIGLPIQAVHETLLQLVLFAGYPRAINAFFSLGKPHLRERVNSGSIALRRRRGVLLCRRIYGGSYRALLENMSRLHPALTEGMLEEGYGRILSRPGLTPRERELLIIPVLAGLDAWRQIPPHLRGAVRVGATVAELRRVLEGVRDLLGRRTDRVLRMLDANDFGPPHRPLEEYNENV